MKITEYAIPAGVVSVEHLGARCETRCHRVEAHCAALRRAAGKIRRALLSREQRLAVANYERFVERSER